MAENDGYDPVRELVKDLNFVVKSFIDPCDAPLTIYVRTLWPALLEAFLAYYEIDLFQTLRTYVTPRRAIAKGRSGRRRGNSSRSSRRLVPPPVRRALGRFGISSRNRSWRDWIIDPWSMLGLSIPQADWLGGRKISARLVTLWIVVGYAFRALWYWWIAGIVVGFFVQWMTAVRRSEYCQEQNRAIFLGTGGNQLVGSVVAYSAFGGLTVEKQRGQITYVAGSGLLGPGRFAIVASCTSTADFELIVCSPNNPFDPATHKGSAQRAPDGSASVDVEIRGGETYGVYVVASEVLQIITDRALYIVQTNTV